MQKHPFIAVRLVASVTIAVVLGVIGFNGPPAATASGGGPYGAASQSERLGCQTSGYKWLGDWNVVGPAGYGRSDVGYIAVFTRPAPNNPQQIRVCAIAEHAGKTWGKALPTSLEVGSVPKAGGTQNLLYWDNGTYRYHTDGRALTPGGGMCAVLHVSITYGGTTFQRWVGPNQVRDKTQLCN